ncbi:hypothetical protein J4405_02470 [Candidatus Woesearchaeota archaeon]|nr:hypothetical protein [Candidatus Woesearchaeota archaeon]
MKKPITHILFSQLVGLLVFIVLLLVANYINEFISSNISDLILGFLNSNVGLLVVISLIFLIAEIFFALDFPFNLVGPLFNAVSSVLLVGFLVDLLLLSNVLIKQDVFSFVKNFEGLISLFVFFIVLIVGYVKIFYEVKNNLSSMKHGRKKKN